MILLDSRVEVMGPAEAEVEVEVEVVRDISRQDGRDRVIDTARIAAMHGGIGDARFQVATENHALRLVPGPRTGHAAFDEACRVDATDEDALRYWLGADEAAAILTLPAAYGAAWSLAVEPWHVELRICAGVEVKGLGLIERLRRAPRPADALPPLIADVDAAVRCIGLLASRSHRLAGTWRTRLAPLGLIAAPPVWGTAPTYVATLGHGRSRATLDFPWLAAPLPAERLRTRFAPSADGPGDLDNDISEFIHLLRQHGVVPDTFKEGAEVVLKGQLRGDTFHTSEVMAKCPSKYAQEGAQKSAMVTRCSKEGAAEKMN